MISRKTKALFYAVAGPAMRLNGVIYRRLRAPRSDVVKVQLGPGREHYLDGWINLDANIFTKNCDVWRISGTNFLSPIEVWTRSIRTM